MPPLTTNAPIVVLSGLEGGAPTSLTGIQALMVPHLELISAMWWSLLFVTLGTLIYKNIIVPLTHKLGRRGSA